VDHEEAGAPMRSRSALLTVVVVVALLAGGGWVLQHQAGPKQARALDGADSVGGADDAPSGAWYCPHGGGKGWTGQVAITNPGDTDVTVRVASMSHRGLQPATTLTVRAHSRTEVVVPAGQREASTEIEYFGGWVAAGWVVSAPGTPAGAPSPGPASPTPEPTGTGGGTGESGSPSQPAVEEGVGADPCANGAGRTWYLPDGSTIQGQEDYVIVMNPFASEASFQVSFVAEARVVAAPGEITVPGGQSVAIHANKDDLGDQTVAAVVTAGIGRVVAASLGIDDAGGVRSDIGVPTLVGDPVIPGAGDAGGTEIPFLNPSKSGITYGVDFLGADGRHLALPHTQKVGPNASRTETLTATGPGAVSLVASGGAKVAAARRTLGIRGDEGSTTAFAPAHAWLLTSPATDNSDSTEVALANTGASPVTVTLTGITDAGPLASAPVTVTVPPDSSVPSPAGFLEGTALASVLAVSDGGPFTAVMTATSKTRSAYAVGAGVPIPPQWVPAG
jgi:hypothetical protein